MVVPSQFCPPGAGPNFALNLVAVPDPPPQITEQEDQSAHIDHEQSFGQAGRKEPEQAA